MAAENTNVDFWSMTSAQLAAGITGIAQADPASFDSRTRSEASLVAAEWRDALNLPRTTFEDQEARRAMLAALQRRSIEILIRTGRNS